MHVYMHACMRCMAGQGTSWHGLACIRACRHALPDMASRGMACHAMPWHGDMHACMHTCICGTAWAWAYGLSWRRVACMCACTHGMAWHSMAGMHARMHAWIAWRGTARHGMEWQACMTWKGMVGHGIACMHACMTCRCMACHVMAWGCMSWHAMCACMHVRTMQARMRASMRRMAWRCMAWRRMAWHACMHAHG